jgi:7-carboxy-7-deazaguanine synthase
MAGFFIMPTTLIKQLPEFTKKVEGKRKLAISEMFCDTLQGEGVNMGVVSTFLRVQGCTLECVWCDTLEVWRFGNEYTYEEIFALFESADLINKFKDGQNLILTGGSPLKQQVQLTEFIHAFISRYGFKPYIQVENEGVLMPTPEFTSLVDVWNNSPKLSNSEMKERARFKPEVIKYLSSLPDSWFKFVITSKEDWAEICSTYLPYISREQIILMPEGVTQEELSKNREFVADMAIEHRVRYCDRLHVILWNKKTGV